MSNPITKYLVVALLAAASSGLFTYSFVSRGYELDISKMKLEVAEANEKYEKERAAHQGQVFVDSAQAMESLTTSINSAKDQANKLKGTLGNVILVSKNCTPSEEFKNIWNASGKQ